MNNVTILNKTALVQIEDRGSKWENVGAKVVGMNDKQNMIKLKLKGGQEIWVKRENLKFLDV